MVVYYLLSIPGHLCTNFDLHTTDNAAFRSQDQQLPGEATSACQRCSGEGPFIVCEFMENFSNASYQIKRKNVIGLKKMSDVRAAEKMMPYALIVCYFLMTQHLILT